MSKRKQSTEPQDVAPDKVIPTGDGKAPKGSTRAKLAPGTDPDATQSIAHVDGPSGGSSDGNGATPKRSSRSKAKSTTPAADAGATESIVIKPAADGAVKASASSKSPAHAEGNGNGTAAAKPKRATSAKAKLSPGVDTEATQAIEHVPAPDSNGSNGAGHEDGKPAEVAVTKAKLAPGTDPALTQNIPLVEPPANSPDVEGPQKARVSGVKPDSSGSGNGVRPIKVRVGSALLDDQTPPGGVKIAVDGNGLSRARVASPAAGAAALAGPSTSSLRGHTDVTGLRMKLMREEWGYGRSRGVHRRPLPHFLMRQRAMRSRSRVGHTRAFAAQRRHGGTGPLGILLSALAAVMLLTLGGFISGVGGVAVATALFIGDLPPVTGAGALHGLQVQTTKIYDRNGIPLYDIVDEQTGRRQEVKLRDVSPLVISATIATEDANFYNNSGIDAVALLRAFAINTSGEGSSGASTITQQVVRNINLPESDLTDVSTQGTARRKLREMVQAVRFTQAYTKNDILEMYLNDNNYGHRAYGIQAAALTYFNKPSKDLTLPEAALLAGLPQAPTYYDPFVNPDVAKARQGIVLNLMAKQGMITQAEADAAKAETLVLRPYQPVLRAPHFVYYVKKYLEDKYGPEVSEAGLVVTTTLDLRVEEAAEKVARDRVDELKKQAATNASIVVMKPGTGEILAMVGSVDYNNQAIDGQVNVATAERQPGSSFKPITYVTAFKGGQYGETGWTPATVILDTLTAFPNPGQKPYTPKNYDGKDHGWVTVRESLGNSLNIPAVKALQFAGVQQVIDTAHDMGIKGLNRGTGWYGLSLTLGGGEVTLLDMTNAYSTFANAGVEVDADPILKIEDPQGRIIDCNGAYRLGNGGCSNTPVRQYADGKGRVIDERLTYMMSSVLSDNKARAMEFGLNSPLHMPFTAAAKTGTTDDNRDSWTLGYTPDLTVGVWVGNSNNARMAAVTGAIGAAVIWHNMMQTFYDNPDFMNLIRGYDGELHPEFNRPDGLIKDSACSNKGTVSDWFLKEAPPKGCVNYKDPKTNKQLGSIPGSSNNNNNSKPRTKPTPIPGIIYPTPVP